MRFSYFDSGAREYAAATTGASRMPRLSCANGQISPQATIRAAEKRQGHGLANFRSRV